MHTALTATSLTLLGFIRGCLESDPYLGSFFDSDRGGSMVLTLNTPQEMAENNTTGLSLWLYRVERDDHRLNAPPERIDRNQLRRTPLPLRLHYLITPVVNGDDVTSAETEQTILGKILQIHNDYPRLSGVALQGDFEGTAVELNIRLEPLSLEEITRVWDALDRAYQLSISYEVSVVYMHSQRQPEDIRPVEVVLPDSGSIVDSHPVS